MPEEERRSPLPGNPAASRGVSGLDFDAAYQGTPPWEIGTPQPVLAELVERGEAPPPTMRTALERLPQLLSRRVLTKLKGIAFLEASSGALLAPVDTYIRSERLARILH